MRRPILLVLLSAILTGCGSEPVSYPRDPRGVYVAARWNGQPLPVFLALDTIGSPTTELRPARRYLCGLTLDLNSQQYLVRTAEYWVYNDTGDTLSFGCGPGAVQDAGTWQYDSGTGRLLFLSTSGGEIELREGDLQSSELLTTGTQQYAAGEDAEVAVWT